MADGWNLTSVARATRSLDAFRERYAGAKGGHSTAWRDYVRADPLLRDVITVVTIVLGGGETYRYATRRARLRTSDGRAVAVDALLMESPDLESTYSLGSGGSSSRSFTFNFGTPDLDPWRLIRERLRPLAGYAEVALVHESMSWDDRFVMMRGDASSGATFGVRGESVQMSVEDPKVTADVAITQYVTDTDRFTLIPEEFAGLRYPLALNSPAKVPCVRLTTGNPPFWLVCLGHQVDVDAVYVDGAVKASGALDFPWSVSRSYDNLGTAVTRIVFTAGTGTWTDTTSVHADLSPRDASRSMDLIATVRELATNWSLLGQLGADQVAYARASNRVGVLSPPSVFINGSGSGDATRAMEYIEGTLCASYPMLSMAWQPGGYGPVLTDRRGVAVAKWVVGQLPLFKREGPWQESAKSDVFNSFTVRYGYDATTDAYAGVVTRDPNNSLLCRASEEWFGPADHDPVESVVLPDEASAVWVADWLVEHRALPTYYAEYTASAEVLLYLRLGDPIDLVDEEIYGCTFDAPVRATVERVGYRRGQVTLGLRLWVLYEKYGGGARS